MGKLGVSLTDGIGAGVPHKDAEPMTQAQGAALLEYVLRVAGGTVVLGAKVVALGDLGWSDVVVFEDGRVFTLAGELLEERRGDSIVDAARKRGWGRAAPEGASLSAPPFKDDTTRPSVLPDGQVDTSVDGPWLAYRTGPGEAGAGEWMPWDSLRSRFEQRTFESEEACWRRAWFLNAQEEGSGLGGMVGVGAVVDVDRALRAMNAERDGLRETDQERIVGVPARAPARRTRVALRQAIWEASQHASPDDLRELFEAVLREIESDAP